MSSRLTVRSSGALAAAAASLLAGIAGAPAASAATVSTTLNYTCRFPLMRPQPLQLKISADLPTSIPQNTPTGAFSIHATANVNDVAASGLRAVSSATLEGTISRNAEARHARTAIGFSRDSSTLILLAVDGGTTSVGATLTELATLMRKLGAWQAMNFDGGGSTTMVIGDTVVNRPTDSTGERDVGNTLVIVRRR